MYQIKDSFKVISFHLINNLWQYGCSVEQINIETQQVYHRLRDIRSWYIVISVLTRAEVDWEQS